MDLFIFKAKLKNQYPVVREPVVVDPRIASVMVILFIHHGEIFILMTRRSMQLKIHPGEMSFPGGRYEEEDGNLLVTALRETREEVGMDLSKSQMTATLPIVQTLTGYAITPYVMILQERPRVGRLSDEVDELFEIPLVKLLSTQKLNAEYKAEENKYVYWHGNNRIWGASAKILQEIERLRST
ncbi:uncharacterized protein METZ01_LOCUS432940 [marine metagenome]|uniref:Nudix hydrolase domain-containing protein n=1 Tax=marine metagenome TaxID=408172 RepID=A0A382Y9U4_9ZZZZ